MKTLTLKVSNEIKEIPILYSTAMVKAKLGGRKTQTRRIIKPQPDEECYYEVRIEERNGIFGIVYDYNQGDDNPFVKCRHGKPGDLLWVREAWCYALDYHDCGWACEYGCNCPTYGYRADWQDDEIKWKPSIHMPKAAARIWDEVISVRAERLQDITKEDAIAEGIEFEVHTWGPIAFPDGTIDYCVNGKKTKAFKDYSRPNYFLVEDPIGSYRTLWESINGKGSWDLNPWVWRIETKTLSTTGRP